MFTSREIYLHVLEAMQNAEEMGGPEGQDYLNLMLAISAEAARRYTTARRLVAMTN